MLDQCHRNTFNKQKEMVLEKQERAKSCPEIVVCLSVYMCAHVGEHTGQLIKCELDEHLIFDLHAPHSHSGCYVCFVIIVFLQICHRNK